MKVVAVLVCALAAGKSSGSGIVKARGAVGLILPVCCLERRPRVCIILQPSLHRALVCCVGLPSCAGEWDSLLLLYFVA